MNVFIKYVFAVILFVILAKNMCTKIRMFQCVEINGGHWPTNPIIYSIILRCVVKNKFNENYVCTLHNHKNDTQ